MSEEWREIPGFPAYEISSLGNVKRVKPDAANRMLAVDLVQSKGNHGYRVVSLHNKGKQSVKTVHRIVCEVFHGPPPSKYHHASHYDGDKDNNSASNLRWLTPHENNMEKHRHGTMMVGDNHTARIDGSYLPRGENHRMAKLNDEIVRSIRSDNRLQREISEELGVSQTLIHQVKSRKIWKHVE